MEFNKKLFDAHEYLKKHEYIETNIPFGFNGNLFICKTCGVLAASHWNNNYNIISNVSLTPENINKILKYGISKESLRAMLMTSPVGATTVSMELDGKPSDETRDKACEDTDAAFNYAIEVDKSFHIKTLSAVAMGDNDYCFRSYLDRIPFESTDKIRSMITNPEKALRYALIVDMGIPNDITRRIACGSPEAAFRYANEVDMRPREDTRTAACASPQTATSYATMVDRAFHQETYNAAIMDPVWACEYALNVMRSASDETRIQACKDPQVAYKYAHQVDRGPHDLTRAAVLSKAEMCYEYAKNIDKCPREDTRKGVRRSAYASLHYAMHIDRAPHPWTKSSACRKGCHTARQYEEFETIWNTWQKNKAKE